MLDNPLRLLFVPGGRVSRMTYFVVSLILFVAMAVLTIVFAFGALVAIFSGNVASAAGLGLVSLLGVGITMLAYIYSCVVVSLKRLHDMGQPGWHVIWIFAAGFLAGMGSDDLSDASSLIGAICMLVFLGGSAWLLFAPGEPFDNAHGPEPL